MTTTQYRNFVTVAECRSITGAARELRIAQPALSAQIKRIEEEYGAALLIRYPRFVELTDAGRAFYQAAKTILQIEENTSIEIANLSSSTGGMLRLGITPFMPDLSFRRILQAFYGKFPGAFVTLYEEKLGDILTKLETGAVEVAVITSPKELPHGFEAVAAIDSWLYACRPADSPYLSGKREGEVIGLTELKGVPISAPWGLYRYIEEHCHNAGFNPIWKALSNSRHATLQLAEQGNMVAVLALSAEMPEKTNLTCNRIFSRDLVIQKYFVVLQGRTLSTAAQNFIGILDSSLSSTGQA